MIDYDGLLKKIPKVKKILDDGSNSNLYHYTKPEKLLNILESETIRFSNALYLNDKEEVTYSYKLIGSLIDEMPGLNSELFSRIKEHFHRKYKNIISGNDTYSSRYEYYTISFSTDSDNLTLWNNYSKGQSYTGYNIGFAKRFDCRYAKTRFPFGLRKHNLQPRNTDYNTQADFRKMEQAV